MTERLNPFRVWKVIDNLTPIDQKIKEVVTGVHGFVWNQRPFAYEYGLTMAWYKIKETGGNVDQEYANNLKYILDLSLGTSRYDFSEVSWSGSRAKPQLLDKKSKEVMKYLLVKMQDKYYLSGPDRGKNIKEITDFLTYFTNTLAESGVLIPDYNNFDALSSVPNY